MRLFILERLIRICSLYIHIYCMEKYVTHYAFVKGLIAFSIAQPIASQQYGYTFSLFHHDAVLWFVDITAIDHPGGKLHNLKFRKFKGYKSHFVTPGHIIVSCSPFSNICWKLILQWIAIHIIIFTVEWLMYVFVVLCMHDV